MYKSSPLHGKESKGAERSRTSRILLGTIHVHHRLVLLLHTFCFTLTLAGRPTAPWVPGAPANAVINSASRGNQRKARQSSGSAVNSV